MAFNISKFINIKDPIKKLAASAASSLLSRAENALIDTAGSLFAKAGLSNSTRKTIMNNLGDAAVAGVASEFFGTFNRGINRASRDQIIDGKGDSFSKRVKDLDVNNAFSPNSDQKSELIFPKDLQKYYTKIEFYQYKRPNPSVTEAGKEYRGSICLPLSRNLEEKHDVSYNSGFELGFLPAAIANEGLTGRLAGKGSTVLNLTTAYAAKLITENLSGLGGNEFYSIIQQEAGASLNPNISVMFRSPTFRSHRFEWLLAPNNEEESEIVRKIIKKIKSAALPNFMSDTTAMLDFPLMCRIRLMPWADPSDKDLRAEYKDNYLFDYKYSVIESVSVNYSPESVVFMNTDSDAPPPAFILVSMNLIEIEYFTAAEYGRETRSTSDIKLIQDLNQFTKDLVDGVLDISEGVSDRVAEILGNPNEAAQSVTDFNKRPPNSTTFNDAKLITEKNGDKTTEFLEFEKDGTKYSYKRDSRGDWEKVAFGSLSSDAETKTVTVITDDIGKPDIGN